MTAGGFSLGKGRQKGPLRVFSGWYRRRQLGALIRKRKCDPRNERRSAFVIARVYLPMVRFENSPRPMKTKTIMALRDCSQGLAAPILRGAIEVSFRFAEDENELVLLGSRLNQDGAFAAVVSKRVRE